MLMFLLNARCYKKKYGHEYIQDFLKSISCHYTQKCNVASVEMAIRTYEHEISAHAEKKN